MPAARLLAHDLEQLVWDDDGESSPSRRRTEAAQADSAASAARVTGQRPSS